MRRATFLGWIAGAILAASVGVAAPLTEICTNGVDDDGDFGVDCGDSDCDSDPACDFGSGCCILMACQPSAHEGGGAGGRPPAEAIVSCFDDFTQPECESRFSGATDPGGGGATVSDCPAFELVEGPCSGQPACPGFARSVPVASGFGVTALALLLAAAGLFYLRRARSS